MMTSLTPRVLVYTDNVEAHAAIRARFPRVALTLTDSEKTYADRAQEAEIVFVARKYDPQPLKKAHNLRWLHLGGTGINPLLPLNQWPADLLLTHTPGLNAAMIADYVQSAFSILVWNVPNLLENQRARRWEKWGVERLEGKTVLLLGLGAIGQEIVRRARAARMRIIAVRRNPVPQKGIARVNGPDSLHELLPEADFVVLALPLTPETRHLIGQRELSLMRQDAYLVNVSRGPIVDQSALVRVLTSRQIAGAMLDVFEKEPLSAHSPLWQLPNVIVTPHIASWSADYRRRAAELFCDNLSRYLSGQPLLHQVDRDRGY